MIKDLDDTIEDLLVEDGGISRDVADIRFDIPNREWSSGISRPTLNCYLFDIRENLDLRQQGRMLEAKNGREAVRRQPALWFSLTYLITAWTRAVEDEHHLLWQTLLTLARFNALPAERLKGSLGQHEAPIYAAVARPDSVLKSPGEFWTALENQLKPSLSYTLTLSVDRAALAAGPPVSSLLLRMWHSAQPGERAAAQPPPGQELQQRLWIGGVVRDQAGAPVPDALVRVEGQPHQAVTDGGGFYRLGALAPSRYTLVASYAGVVERREVLVGLADSAGGENTTVVRAPFDIRLAAPESGTEATHRR